MNIDNIFKFVIITFVVEFDNHYQLFDVVGAMLNMNRNNL